MRSVPGCCDSSLPPRCCRPRSSPRRRPRSQPLHPRHAEPAPPRCSRRSPALFAAFEAGDAAAMLRQVHPDGRVTASGPRADGGTTLRQQTWLQFADRVRPDRAFTERIADPVIDIDDDIAMVWAPFVVRVGGKVSNCGIDHFDLVRESGRWKVMNLTFSSRTAGCPAQAAPAATQAAPAAARPRVWVLSTGGHHCRHGRVADRSVELQGRDAARSGARRCGAADHADRRRHGRADRQRRQQRHHPGHLAEAGQADQPHPRRRPGGRRRRRDARHQHARGNRLLPQPDGEVRSPGRPGGLDAAGHRHQRRRSPQPAERRPHRRLPATPAARARWSS